METQKLGQLFRNVFQISETDKDMNRIISAGFWGVIPLMVGILLMVFLAMWMCFFCSMRRKIENKKFTIFSLTFLTLIAIFFVASAFKSSELSALARNVHKPYYNATTWHSSIMNDLNSAKLAVENNSKRVFTRFEEIEKSSDYQLVNNSYPFPDHSKHGMDNISSLFASIEAILWQYNISKYIQIHDQEYWGTIHAVCFGSLSVLIVVMQVSIYYKTVFLTKILFGLTWLIACTGLFEAAVFISVPMAISAMCGSFDRSLADKNDSLTAYLFNCTLNKTNILFGQAVDVNFSASYPSFYNVCSILPKSVSVDIGNACRNVSIRFQNVVNESITESRQLYSGTRLNVESFLSCDGLSTQMNDLKCGLCVDLPNISIKLGVFSTSVIMIFFLHAFVLPFLWRMKRLNWEVFSERTHFLDGKPTPTSSQNNIL